jgi:Fe-S cluster biogenesis protein NfuA
MTDDQIFEAVDKLLKTQINPAVAQHGGKVDLIDVEEGVVMVRMLGGCQGCGMAKMTLQQGIEAALKRSIPDVKGIRDITDHAAGTSPYIASNPG